MQTNLLKITQFNTLRTMLVRLQETDSSLSPNDCVQQIRVIVRKLVDEIVTDTIATKQARFKRTYRLISMLES